MLIQETVNNMMQYVREGEYCSCPYIFEDSDGKGLKMFTFLAMENEQTTIYGIGQVITCGVDGTIQCEEGNIFQNESDLIVIADDKKVTPEERDELYQTYYAALDAYISGEELDKEPIYRSLSAKGPVVIGDNVWIGENVCVLSGVTIGQGCVIAANAVVTKDMPPYSLVAGVPARVVRCLENC